MNFVSKVSSFLESKGEARWNIKHAPSPRLIYPTEERKLVSLEWTRFTGVDTRVPRARELPAKLDEEGTR